MDRADRGGEWSDFCHHPVFSITNEEWDLLVAYRRGERPVYPWGQEFQPWHVLSNVHKPWPMEGGLEGSPNYAEVVRTDGSVQRFAVVTGLSVNEGDVIRIHTGSGGGFGDPRRRPRELVLEDLRNGFVTQERAAEVYGVRPEA